MVIDGIEWFSKWHDISFQLDRMHRNKTYFNWKQTHWHPQTDTHGSIKEYPHKLANENALT